MSRLARLRILILGMSSPLLALAFYTVVYNRLTNASTNREQDWLFRLSVSTLAMTVPFFLTLFLVLRYRSKAPLSVASKVGAAIAVLSLGLTAAPIRDGIHRWKQTRNAALRGVPAPLFDTTDLTGAPQRLADQKGKVVLVNIWATWCGPCRAEMPSLDRLYRERRQQGFIVFGISDEDPATQQKFLRQIPVSYPLLKVNDTLPNLYRDIARYPAIFLVDRNGNLQPAPDPGLPFEKITATVDALLASAPQSSP
jgi:thiol-disulfide isomerase/thioredoxin